MIGAGIRQICILSVICGAVLSVTPEGGVKRVTELVCTAMLVLSAAGAVGQVSIESALIDDGGLQSIESAFRSDVQNTEDKLNRMVIEERYESYIMDKAEELNIEISAVKIEMQRNSDGLFIPWETEITTACGDIEKNRLGSIICEDFGIPFERQHWTDER